MKWVMAFLLLIFVCMLSLIWGEMGLLNFFSMSESEKVILFDLRFPRLLLGLWAGGILSLAGLTFQGLFRNDLASPYTLGVASGASFGVCLGYYLDVQEYLPIPGLGNFLLAIGGSFLSIGLIYLLAKLCGGYSSHQIILAGVVVSFLFSGFILLTQFLALEMNAHRMIQWLMGDLGIVGSEVFFILGPLSLLLILLLHSFRHQMNLLALGDDFAESRGIQVEKIKKYLFFLTSLMVGLVVSLCGPIGFVGLMVPHIVKSLCGFNFEKNFLFTFLIGAIFLISCDLFSRVGMASQSIPIGIVTSLLGGPFFLFLLIKKANN